MTRPIGNVSATTQPAFFPGSTWQQVDAMLKANRWDLTTSSNVTFSFPDLLSRYPADLAAYVAGTDNFVGNTVAHFESATAAVVTTARAVIASQFAAVTAINFLEMPASTLPNYYTNAGDNRQNGSDLFIGMADLTSGGLAFQPGNGGRAGDVWFDSWTNGGVRSTRFDTITLGDNDYRVVMHEIGHALGLRHGHEGVSGSDLAPSLVMPSNLDSMEFSLMTYRMYEGHTGFTDSNYPSGVETFGFAQTLMMLDIQALQYMYGADFTTNNGHSTYTFSTTTGEMFIDGVGQGTPGANRIFRTIWDGGGFDTYDLSNYTTNLVINLAPGGWSVFSDAQRAILDVATNQVARGNVFNALQYQGDARSLIEGATGGSGNDNITGNGAANTLIGGGGSDTLSGAEGADLLWGSYGADGVADTLIGGAGSDTYFVYETSETVTETDANPGTGGLDLVYSFSNRALGANVEYLTLFGNNASLSSVGGNNLDNALNAMQYVGGSGINFVDDIGNDIVFGSYYADNISTGVGNDTLWGSWGADGRADVMAGGDGADTYYVQEALDTVSETNTSTAASEVDTVYAGINTTLGANLEYLFIYGSATVATGNSLNNALIGSYSGLQLTFNGLGGSDSITGGAGNDTIDGGAGVDYLTGSGGADEFRFTAGQANGDYIIDFDGAGAGALDSLRFVGYGAGATFTQLNASQWRVTYNGGASIETINFFNSASVNAQDVLFV